MTRVFRNLALVGCCVMAANCAWAVGLPYADTFDGGALGGAWSVGGSGTVAPSTDAKWPDVGNAMPLLAGDQGCIVSNGSLTLSATPSTYSNVWFHFAANPVAGESDPPVTNVSGAFYVSTSGMLRAYGSLGAGNGWTNIGSVAGGWKAIAVHADYVANKYDVYVGGGPNTALTKLGVVAFPSAHSNSFTSVSVDSGGKAFVDAAAVSIGLSTVGGSSPSKLMISPVAAGTYDANEFPLRVYSDVYTNVLGANTLAGQVGYDIASGLYPGDTISILNGSVSGGFDVYQVQPNGGWAEDLPGIMTAPSLRKVQLTDVVSLHRPSASGLGVEFFAYNSIVAENGVKKSGAPAIPVQITLYGVESGNPGWTSLNWPTPVPNAGALPINNANNAQLAIGDKMFIQKTAGSKAYDEYWWNGTSWKFWAANPTAPIPGGGNIWVKRSGTSPATMASINF